ncbi:hypothetical protein DUNSADRAFT_7943 [Dunaliella salina]|uniref:Encoded protein n=1 Tax=Dunaliella salina TaxID=3046 RepID=A0ABQ7H5Z3_DUNSA|nr:hypothetical protein DUNSADRAFT_7943 [Dunaliella salina]|eukprot:KAF5842290.1 hypothetical protein DUNSADRAFT_7943 [Dunaliella salina]
MAAIGQLNALQTLTIWIKDFIDEEALAHLKGLQNLSSLQIARLSISAAPHHLFPLSLPQVQTLSYYLARITAPARIEFPQVTYPPSASDASSVPLFRLFPSIHSATLRDWPMLTDPSFLGPPLEDAPVPEGSGGGRSWHCTAPQVLPSSHPIQSLLLLQHTPLHSPLLPPPHELHPRTALYMKPIRQLTSLKSITFKHFTSPLHVRELCSLAAHLPNLTALTLEASAKACKVRNPVAM